MSEERDSKSDAGGHAGSEGGAPAEESAGAGALDGAAPAEESAGAPDAAVDEAAESAPERVDADGLPLDRDATIDDVRSTEARHGRIAVGCTLVIVLFIVLFWALRGGLIG